MAFAPISQSNSLQNVKWSLIFKYESIKSLQQLYYNYKRGTFFGILCSYLIFLILNACVFTLPKISSLCKISNTTKKNWLLFECCTL